MGEKVIVVLDRGTADYLRLLGNDHHSPEFFSDCYQGEVMPAVEAALGRDREALIEKVAREIDPVAFRTDLIWQSSSEPARSRSKARRQAEAALAAIERAEQEEGNRG